MRLAVVVAAVTLASAALPSASASALPPGLSHEGRALWNFEALLHDTFGNREVCARTGTLNFVAGSCSPLSDWQWYSYTFASARRSAFHLARRSPRGAFGAHPILIRVKGRFVACDQEERTYLIHYGGAAGLDLDCLRPL